MSVRPPIQSKRLGELDEELISKAETGGTWCSVPAVVVGDWGTMLDDEELELVLWSRECDIEVSWSVAVSRSGSRWVSELRMDARSMRTQMLLVLPQMR